MGLVIAIIVSPNQSSEGRAVGEKQTKSGSTEGTTDRGWYFWDSDSESQTCFKKAWLK